MARFVKPKDKWHRVKISADGDRGELLLVVGGRRAYLWAGRNDSLAGCITVSGSRTLRKLAKEILSEIPE